jgi:hypothetical protein
MCDQLLGCKVNELLQQIKVPALIISGNEQLTFPFKTIVNPQDLVTDILQFVENDKFNERY